MNKEKDYFGHGIPILNYMDVNENIINNESSITGLVDVSDEELNRYNVKFNDLFFTRTSETSKEIGLTSAYLGNLDKCVFSGFILRARPKNDNINSLFIAYQLRNDKYRNNIIKYSSITTRALISGSNLNNLKLKIPKLKEQNKITNFFKCVDRKIELLEQRYKCLQTFKYGFFNNYVDNLIEKPKDNIKKYKLGQLITILDKRNKNNEPFPVLSINNKLGFISQEDQFGDRIIASENKSNYKIVEKGNFAYNPARINVGSIAQLKTYNIGIISPMYIVFNVEEDKLNPNFLENYIFTSYFAHEIKKRLEGSVRLVLSAESLNNIEIFIPNIIEQNKISNFLEKLTFSIKQEKSNLLKFKEFKKALLQKMFI